MDASKALVIAIAVFWQALPHSTSSLFRSSFNHNKSLFPYGGGSRGEGDIEIGPDPNFQCPPDTPVAPHPEKCELYYTCYPGSPVTLWQCYSNYLFDLTYSGCNFPEEVDCGDRQRPTTTTNPTTTTIATTKIPPFTCLENGFYPVSDCSSQYYLCVDGDVYPQNCPNDGIFDPSLGYCVSEDQVSACQKSTTPLLTSTTTDSMTTSTSGSTPKPIDCTADGFFAFEPCLTLYYACVDGVPYFQECPNDWIFVEAESECKPPEQTNCFDLTSDSTTITTTSNCDLTTPASNEFSCPNTETNFYPVFPGACVADYYTCYLGEVYPQTCPEGYIFDETMKQCVSQDNASCTPCVTVISSQV